MNLRGNRDGLTTSLSRIFSRLHLAGLVVAFLPVSFSISLSAQTVSQTEDTTAAVAVALPDAPDPQTGGSISGTVKDTSGAPVAAAEVTVVGKKPPVHRTLATDDQGSYRFAGLPAGIYQVTVSGQGLEPMQAMTVPLGEGEAYNLPITATPVPKFSSTVTVTATPVEIATAQVHEEMKQRVLGVIPNFYTSYLWNAAPMTPKLKYHLVFRSVFDPITIAGAAGIAGAEQWRNTYPGYGPGWEGYGKRFGASYADSFVARLVGDAMLPAVFHQDPRYFYRGSGSWETRTGYSLKQSVLCRGDNGKTQFAYSRLLGDFIAAGFSNVYHAPSDRTASVTFRDAGVIIGADAVENLLREFLSKSLTSHVPKFANGKKSAEQD